MYEYIWNIHGRSQFYAILTRQNEKPTGLHMLKIVIFPVARANAFIQLNA